MVKLRYILVMVLMATASTPVFAGWKVVITSLRVRAKLDFLL